MIGRLFLFLAALPLLVITMLFVPVAQPPPMMEQAEVQTITNEQSSVQGQVSVFIDQQLSQATNAGAAQQVVVSWEAPTTLRSQPRQIRLLPQFMALGLGYDYAAPAFGAEVTTVLRV